MKPRGRLPSLPGMAGHLQSTIASKGQGDSRPPRSADFIVEDQRRTGFLQGRRIGLVSAILNLTNAIIGSGVLGLPYIAATSGTGLFLVLLMLSAMVIDYSLQLLIAAANVTAQPGKRFSYELLGEQAFGIPGRLLVSVFIMTQNTANMTSYFVVFKDVIGDIMGLATDSALLTNARFMTCMMALCIVFPISSSSKIGPLAYAGMLQIVIIFAFVAYVFAMAVYHGTYYHEHYDKYLEDTSFEDAPEAIHHENDTMDWFAPSKDTFLAMPTFCFSFICHTALLPIYDELQEADDLGRTRRPRKRIALAVHTAIAISTALYVVVSVSGYALFGTAVKSDLLVNFSNDFFKPLNHYARIAFTLSVVLSVPLQCFPFRKALTSVIAILRGTLEPMTCLAKEIWALEGYKEGLDAEERADGLGIELEKCYDEPTRKFISYVLMNPNLYQYTVPEDVDTDLLGSTLDRYVHWIRYGELMLGYVQTPVADPGQQEQGEEFEVEGCCPQPRDGWLPHLLKTAVAIGLCLFLALEVPAIKEVFAVAGATSSVWLELILPAAIYVKLCLRKANLSDVRKYGSILDDRAAEDDESGDEVATVELKESVSRWAFIFPSALCIFGWLVFLISWSGNIWRWVDPSVSGA